MSNMITLAISAMLRLFADLLAESGIHFPSRSPSTIAAYPGLEPSPLMGLRPLFGSSGGRICGRKWLGPVKG